MADAEVYDLDEARRKRKEPIERAKSEPWNELLWGADDSPFMFHPFGDTNNDTTAPKK